MADIKSVNIWPAVLDRFAILPDRAHIETMINSLIVRKHE
jgi:hypothetical protein